MRMKKAALLFLPWILFAKVHMVKVEPFMIYHYKAAASGEVVLAKDSKEARVVEDEVLVKIDDKIDRKTLVTLQKKLQVLEKIIAITRKNLQNTQEIMQIKEGNYVRIKDLKTKSSFEKNMRKAEYLAAKSSYLNLQEKLQNLLIQKADIKLQIAKTKDIIAKKSLRVSGYVYKIYPKRGDFVNFAAPLFDIADISRAKVVLYLTPEEMQDIQNKKIFINGKRSNARFYKIQRITDQNYITQYRAEVIIPAPKIFGKFIEVEIR